MGQRVGDMGAMSRGSGCRCAIPLAPVTRAVRATPRAGQGHAEVDATRTPALAAQLAFA